MTDEEPKTYRCRAGTETQRCSFRGTREELRDHADEMGHPRCVVPKGKDDDGEPRRCATTLAWHEQQSCDDCIRRVRDDLDAVAASYAHLERIILQAARRGTSWDALTFAADGSLAGLKPFRETVLPEVEIERQTLAGETITHPGYTERRRVKRPGDVTVPPTGREHFDDHWPTDPLSVLAFLEHNERDWRHEFGHGPAVDIATVGGCLAYLRDWHAHAARLHPGFDDYAADVRQLRVRLERVVGMADDPLSAPAKCFDCSGQLVRTYVQPADTDVVPEHDCSVCDRRHAGRHGNEGEGLTDDWTCRSCGRVYDQASYFLALRASRDECQGWVPVKVAAAVLRVPESTLFRWVARGEVETMRENGRTFVEWSEVSVLREERAS